MQLKLMKAFYFHLLKMVKKNKNIKMKIPAQIKIHNISTKQHIFKSLFYHERIYNNYH